MSGSCAKTCNTGVMFYCAAALLSTSNILSVTEELLLLRVLAVLLFVAYVHYFTCTVSFLQDVWWSCETKSLQAILKLPLSMNLAWNKAQIECVLQLGDFWWGEGVLSSNAEHSIHEVVWIKILVQIWKKSVLGTANVPEAANWCFFFKLFERKQQEETRIRRILYMSIYFLSI